MEKEVETIILLLNKELEEEHSTLDNKEFIKSYIDAKKWVYRKIAKNYLDATIYSEIIGEDIKKYLLN